MLQKVCEEFDFIFIALLIFSWIPILTRTLALFTIGWHTDARKLDVLRPLDVSPESLKISKLLASGFGWEQGSEGGQKAATKVKNISKEKNVEVKRKKKKSGSSGSGDSTDSPESKDGDGEYSIQLALDEFYKHGNKPTEMAKALQFIRDR